MLALPLPAGLGVGKGTAHRRWQAREVTLEHIVGSAAQQRIDRSLFTDRAGHIDEWDFGCELAGDAQRRYAVELWEAEIRQDQVGREALERLSQPRFGLDAQRGAFDAGPSQLCERELGLVVEVLDEQNADRFGGLFEWHDPSLC